MLSTQNLAGYATFTFDYFLNGGSIACSCPDCHSEIRLPIAIYRSGKLVEELKDQYGPELLDILLERRIVNLKDENNRMQSNLEKYILWNMDALFEILSCNGCSNSFLAVFGMAEIQPGREEIQFIGIWKLTNTN